MINISEWGNIVLPDSLMGYSTIIMVVCSTIQDIVLLYCRNQKFSAMENEKTYDMPYMGCMMGAAFQRLISQLEVSLRQKGLDISAAEYMIVRALYSRDGLQQCEIADLVGKDKSSICRSIAAMQKKNLIHTEPISYKCIRVWLTDLGLDIRPKIMSVAAERHQALLDLAPAEDIEAFGRVLKAILG